MTNDPPKHAKQSLRDRLVWWVIYNGHDERIAMALAWLIVFAALAGVVVGWLLVFKFGEWLFS